MALLEPLICLVCNSNVNPNSYRNVFYEALPHNEEILGNYILKVLKVTLTEISTPFICPQCYKLFKMLDEAQWTVSNILSEICKVFKNSNDIKNIKANEISNNFGETENVNQISQLKRITKDLNSLNNDINNITNETTIYNEINANNSIQIDDNKEFKVFDQNAAKCSETDKVSDELYEIEAVNLNNDISIFSNVNNVSKTENQKNHVYKEEENISNVQKETIENPVSNSKSLDSEKTSKGKQKPLKHTCPTCDKKWRTPTELKTHMKSHSDVKPYMCEKCGQAYKHKQALEIHVGMHNGVSPFQCTYCEKCFTQKGALQRHLPLHTGETPYQCELCGKRFIHHTSYNMHALSHTGKKSYKCHICDLSLLSTSHLKRHLRAHTGERPYSCEICGKSFAERYNLLSHQKIHDPLQVAAREIKKNQYKCDQCETSFPKRQQYEDHLKQHVDSTNSNDYPRNGADLLESCVSEVWQSLTKSNNDRLKVKQINTPNMISR